VQQLQQTIIDLQKGLMQAGADVTAAKEAKLASEQTVK